MPRVRERVGVERRRRLEPGEERVPALVEVVVPADEMDDETFCKHMNYRHLQDLGLNRIEHHERTLPGYYATLRAYHERLHALALRGTYNHEHGV